MSFACTVRSIEDWDRLAQREWSENKSAVVSLTLSAKDHDALRESFIAKAIPVDAIVSGDDPGVLVLKGIVHPVTKELVPITPGKRSTYEAVFHT